MSSYQQAQERAQTLCIEAIDEACGIALQDGGTVDVLKLLAILKNGEVLPAPVLVRLEEQAAKIVGAA